MENITYSLKDDDVDVVPKSYQIQILLTSKEAGNEWFAGFYGGWKTLRPLEIPELNSLMVGNILTG